MYLCVISTPCSQDAINSIVKRVETQLVRQQHSMGSQIEAEVEVFHPRLNISILPGLPKANFCLGQLKEEGMIQTLQCLDSLALLPTLELT